MNNNTILLLCVLLSFLSTETHAESFIDKLLRFTGISVTANQLRSTFIIGNLWVANLDSADQQQITIEGEYHSPLWIPNGDGLVAIKENQLIQLHSDGSNEKNIYHFTGFTVLLGFKKNDANTILILHDAEPALFSLLEQTVEALPYDKNNPNDLDALNRLMSGFKDYGKTQVFIEKLNGIDADGVFQANNKIHIKQENKQLVVDCPSKCSQAALNNNKSQLVFVGEP